MVEVLVVSIVAMVGVMVVGIVVMGVVMAEEVEMVVVWECFFL